jgi:hypothetical protein
VILRGLAVLATLVIPALGLLVGDALPGWALPSIAAAVASPLIIARPKALLSLAIVAGLAALSAATVLDAGALMRITADPDDWPAYDLTQEALPDEAEGYVSVRGHLRDEWTLDEYRVEEGGRPNQNEDAAAELVPLLGTDEMLVAPEGRIIIARVAKDPGRAKGLTALRGKLEPLPEGILTSLVHFGPEVDKASVEGVMLDATRVPTRQQAWTQAAIALVASLLALALAWLALGDKSASGDERPGADAS